MEKMSFVLSILGSVCAGLFLITSIINPSPMKVMAIIIAALMFSLTLLAVRITYKELKERDYD